MYKKIILLGVMLGNCCLQAMQTPLMSLPVLLAKGLKDLNSGRGTDELIEILRKDSRYLMVIDPDTKQSLLDFVIEALVAAKHVNDDKEQRARFNALESLLTRIIRLGRGNELFVKLVDQKRQGMMLNEKYFQPVLSCLIKEFPEMFKLEGRKKAQPARPKKTRSNFIYTKPSPELICDGKLFYKIKKDFEDHGIYSDIELPNDLLLEHPITGQSLIYFIARGWKTYPQDDQHGVKAVERAMIAFTKILKACAKDPVFLWQVKHLMALFNEDEGGYAPLIQEFNSIVGSVRYEQSSYEMKTVFEWYKEDKLFKRPEISQQEANEKKSALYAGQIFHYIEYAEIEKLRTLLKRNPSLAQVCDEYGLPLTHALMKKHSDYCAKADSASWEKEIKKVEAVFGQVLFAGAQRNTRPDRFVRMRVDGSGIKYKTIKEGEYPSVEELLTHPEVNEFSEGYINYGGVYHRDPTTVSIHPKTKEALGLLLGLNREAFIKKYHWMDTYIPKPIVKESVNQSKDSKKAAEHGAQPVPSEVQQEPKPTFFDSWKGTIKYFAVGALAGAALYYGVKRYNSTPEELYSPKNSAVA